MEEADILYDANGLTIMDTSVGLVVEFEDEDEIKHGFSIAHGKLGNPTVWQAAILNLNEWIGD